MRKDADSNSEGASLRDIRKRAGLTLQQLGERVGVTKSSLSKYENGFLSDRALEIYANLAGVGIEEMRTMFPKKQKESVLDGLESLHPTAIEAFLSLERSIVLFKRAGMDVRSDAAEIVRQGELTQDNVGFLFDKQNEGAFYEKMSETVEESLARVRKELKSYAFPPNQNQDSNN